MTTIADVGTGSHAVRDSGRSTGQLKTTAQRGKSERRLGIILAAPAFVVMLAVTAYPILNALYLSLFNYRLTDAANRAFIGLRNYRVILTDSLWWNSVGATLMITVITVVVEFVLGMVFAMVMNRIVVPRRTLRTIILIPYSIITVVSAFGWQYAFSNTTGFVDRWFGLGTYNWFGGFWSSLVPICVSEIWKTAPFMSLLLLAGLANIGGELTEAGVMDGASFWQRLFQIIIPNMKGAIMVALLFRALDAFRIFDNVFIMTAGQNNTETVSLLAYDQTINRTELGLGSAVSVLLFLCVVLIAALFIKGFRTDIGAVRGE